ncbi:MAG: hypothetical protein ACRDTH_03205 [Pseudonocardiaceae bacterium]
MHPYTRGGWSRRRRGCPLSATLARYPISFPVASGSGPRSPCAGHPAPADPRRRARPDARRLVARRADRPHRGVAASHGLAVLRGGRVVEHGTTGAVLTRPEHPYTYTRVLINAARRLHHRTA